MHSALVRAQNTFGFFTTVAFCISIVTALSVLLVPQNPSAEIVVRNVQVVKGRPHYYSPKREEYAHIKFDLDADFSSLFNWNTKQLFVWITATYPSTNISSPSSPLSQAVIWDTIINSETQLDPFNPLKYIQDLRTPPRKASKGKKSSEMKQKKETNKRPGVIQLRNSKPKYQITDISGKISELSNVTLEVGWNVQPWVGALTWTMAEGNRLARWKGVKGGYSKSFNLPPLKGKTASSGSVVMTQGKPEAAEASAVI